MLAPNPAAHAASNFAAVQSGSVSTVTAQLDTSPDFWLRDACRVLLGKDAGFHLHLLTSYPERTCYRYASGEREASPDFLRRLFCSDQGEPFFLAWMESCRAGWWREWQREREIGRDTIARCAR